MVLRRRARSGREFLQHIQVEECKTVLLGNSSPLAMTDELLRRQWQRRAEDSHLRGTSELVGLQCIIGELGNRKTTAGTTKSQCRLVEPLVSFAC